MYTIQKELVTLLQDESLEVIRFLWNLILLVTLKRSHRCLGTLQEDETVTAHNHEQLLFLFPALPKDASVLWIERRKIRCLNSVNPHCINLLFRTFILDVLLFYYLLPYRLCGNIFFWYCIEIFLVNIPGFYFLLFVFLQ